MAQINDKEKLVLEITAKNFAQLYENLSSQTNFYIVIGAENSGKSTTIDLLAGKQIIQIKDEKLQVMKLQTKQRNSSLYPDIHIASIQNNGIKSIFLESYSSNHQLPVVNLIKSFFLTSIADRLKNIAIILTIEQSQKQKISQTVQSLLQFFGISQSQPNLNSQQFNKYFYLLLTKTEEDQSLQMLNQIILEILQEQNGNPNVHSLLKSFRDEDKIMVFKNQQPKPQLSNDILTKFVPIEITQYFRTCLSYELVIIGAKLDASQQKSATQYTIRLIKLINTLVSYAVKNPSQKIKQKDKTQKNIRTLYGDFQHQEFDINKVIINWDSSIIKQIRFEQIDSLSNLDIFRYLIQMTIRIAQSFDKGPEKLQKYPKIIGSLVFCHKMSTYFDPQALQQQVIIMKKQLANYLHYSPPAYDKKQTNLKHSLPQLDKKQTKTKPVTPARETQQTPITKFKNTILNKCENNHQAINYCLQTIKNKQKTPDFEWSDAIYQLKLLRQILKRYNFNKQQECIFAEQLLQLYRYTDDFYDFDQLLNRYLRTDNIHLKIIMNIYRNCEALQWYQCCIKCLNYAISNTIDDQIFQILLKNKSKILNLYYQQYKNRSDPDSIDAPLQQRSYNLQITLNNIEQKAIKTKDLSAYLLADDYRKILSQDTE